jgi:subtilisin family serine protease
MGWFAFSRPRKSTARHKPRKTILFLELLEARTLLDGLPAVVPAVDPTAGDAAHILVRFTSEAAATSVLAGTTVGPAVSLVVGLHEVDLAPGVSSSAALAAYQADPNVLYAQPDGPVSVADTVFPNDPSFGSLWGLNNTGQSGGTLAADIHAPAAWAVTTGSSKTTVAVIDTGIDYDHPDLYQNIWINQAEIPKTRLLNLIDVDGDGLITFRDLNDPRNQGVSKITDINGDGRIDAADILAPMKLDARGNDTGLGGWAHNSTQDGDTQHPDDLVGWNFVTNTNNPFDDNGHGTHVSGIIGAQGNNGVGVTGVDWNVQLIPLKFLDGSGNGYDSDAVAALNYAIQHGAALSNNSWDGAGNDPALANAIQAAQNAGQIFVAAAGNDHSNNDVTPDYPADFRYDNVVTVAATDSNDQLASFSNYGPGTVDLGAPGVNIYSTLPNRSFGWLSGTSMAAPYVTGVLALVRGQHPDWSYRQVIYQVLSTVDPDAGLIGRTTTGGRLDAAAAVGSVTPGTAFVEELYQDLLGRAPEPGALNGWVNSLLQGYSRQQVAQAIWNSAEHRGREVDQFYLTYLHRAADPVGRAGWVNALMAGLSETTVITVFLNSAEYLAAHASDSNFVAGLYRDVLRRSAGAAEQASWVNALQAGLSRQLLVSYILMSGEAIQHMLQPYYTTFLNRRLGSQEAASWVSVVQSGWVSLGNVALAILSSDEYLALALRRNGN